MLRHSWGPAWRRGLRVPILGLLAASLGLSSSCSAIVVPDRYRVGGGGGGPEDIMVAGGWGPTSRPSPPLTPPAAESSGLGGGRVDTANHAAKLRTRRNATGAGAGARQEGVFNSYTTQRFDAKAAIGALTTTKSARHLSGLLESSNARLNMPLFLTIMIVFVLLPLVASVSTAWLNRDRHFKVVKDKNDDSEDADSESVATRWWCGIACGVGEDGLKCANKGNIDGAVDQRIAFTKWLDAMRIYVSNPLDEDRLPVGGKDQAPLKGTEYVCFSYGIYMYNVGMSGIYLFLMDHNFWLAGQVLLAHSLIVCLIVFLARRTSYGDKAVDFHENQLSAGEFHDPDKYAHSNVYRNVRRHRHFFHPRGPLGVFLMQSTLFYHYVEGVTDTFMANSSDVNSPLLVFYWLSGQVLMYAINNEFGQAVPGFLPFKAWSHLHSFTDPDKAVTFGAYRYQLALRYVMDVLINAGVTTFVWFSLPLFLMILAGRATGLDFVMNLTAVVFIVNLDKALNDDPAEGTEDFKQLENKLVRLMDELKKNDRLDEKFDARAPSNQGGSKGSQNKAKRVPSANVVPAGV